MTNINLKNLSITLVACFIFSSNLYADKICIKSNGKMITKRKCRANRGEVTLDLTSLNELISSNSSSSSGEKGDKGDVGPQGPQGPKGDIGTSGSQGPKGDNGDVGPQGPQGPKGDTGSTGRQGLQGDRGPKGDKGDKGDIGDTGRGIEEHTIYLGGGGAWNPGRLLGQSLSVLSLGATARVTTSALGANKNISLPFTMPNYLKIKSLKVCYKTSNETTFIRKTSINKVNTGESRFNIFSDSTQRDSKVATCYTITPAIPVAISGSLAVELNLDFSAPSHTIDINEVSIVAVPN